MENVIEMRGIWSQYQDVVIHRDLAFQVAAGEVVALVGGSGSGKTTLLREILGLLKPVRGMVKLFGVDLSDPDPMRQRNIRQRLGMLFQQGALFSALSVFDNIAFPLRELKRLDEDWVRDLVHMKLQMVELEPHHAQLMPAELSGGMIKRVALARALAAEPELLLLDEPTAGLDPVRSRNFVRLIKDLQKSIGFTVVLVTHDLETIEGLGSDVAVLAEQRILVKGSLEAVAHFDHPFTRQFFGAPSV
ncbi:MAG: ATP-binding cassette domain-containing protein [Zoogloeaceae bacterium]|jgi:phospholipid/cholesterol/gamma-HCH transport system ATP-binding protein|nr:ATP-binding cassette domain-containing protein [Zoogloeaceae bacterium]